MQVSPIKSPPRHGPLITESGVRYRLWSPQSKMVSVQINPVLSREFHSLKMNRHNDGWFEGLDTVGKAGNTYEFLLDDETKLPDVASRFQPQGVRGPSQVIDSGKFTWRTDSFKRPALDELVIYEIHVGTFTRDGTFVSAIDKLKHLQALGVNAIQLMPISSFPGERNWGYDVVLHYAPSAAYGTPDDLRRLVDAAHQLGLTVILDVVYNHVCGEPNHLLATSPHYFQKKSGNAWGSSLNFDGEESAAVRAFFIENAIYWLDEFRVDGLRLDATHAIVDSSRVHVLQEIAAALHARGGFAIAEDDRNEAKLIKKITARGLGLDAVWADDFHHVIKMALKPEPVGHFRSYQGTIEELTETLENGWLFRGQNFPAWKKPRGTECRTLPPSQFIHCISNHDQSGNRPLGERLNHLVSPEAYRAASMLLLLSPYTPMLFMGQEWAASTPFVFFTNHEGDFGAAVGKGRLKEFQHFESHWPDEMLNAMLDPEKIETFSSSKLNWPEVATTTKSQMLEFYRQCLGLRACDPVLRRRERGQWIVWNEEAVLFLRYGGERGAARLLVTHLEDKPCDVQLTSKTKKRWAKMFSSNDRGFGGDGSDSFKITTGNLKFKGPETILLRRDL